MADSIPIFRLSTVVQKKMKVHGNRSMRAPNRGVRMPGTNGAERRREWTSPAARPPRLRIPPQTPSTFARCPAARRRPVYAKIKRSRSSDTERRAGQRKRKDDIRFIRAVDSGNSRMPRAPQPSKAFRILSGNVR